MNRSDREKQESLSCRFATRRNNEKAAHYVPQPFQVAGTSKRTHFDFAATWKAKVSTQVRESWFFPCRSAAVDFRQVVYGLPETE
jgi:hypothetical protein